MYYDGGFLVSVFVTSTEIKIDDGHDKHKIVFRPCSATIILTQWSHGSKNISFSLDATNVMKSSDSVLLGEFE